MIETTRYTKSNLQEWNSFLSSAKNALFLFHRDYLDYHADRFEDHSLLFRKNEKLLAILPANQSGKQIYSHRGLTFGGLIMERNIRAEEVLEVMESAMQYYRNQGFESITYKAIPYIFHNYPAGEDLYALFRVNAQLIRRDIASVVDLSNPMRFSETKRQMVAKCKKLEVEVKHNTEFSEYWQLLTSVLQKFDTQPVHTLTEITGLHKSFPDNIRLYEARIAGKLIAGIVIYDYDSVVHTQYMANSEEGRKIGALDYINSVLISEIYRDRKFYSFGISNENEGRVLNNGLILQKEMMGGRGIAFDFYKISL